MTETLCMASKIIKLDTRDNIHIVARCTMSIDHPSGHICHVKYAEHYVLTIQWPRKEGE